MAFYGSSFTFNSVSCDEYNLMIYDVDGNGQDEGQFITREPIEERLPRSYAPLYYGSTFNRPLEFRLVFGISQRGIQLRIPMDRWDMEAIATWLTGPDGYQMLEIEQGDLDTVHYKCMISELQQISFGWETFAMSCKVRCDSPYAYSDIYKFRYVVNLGQQSELYNRSTHCGFFMPEIKITGISAGLAGRSVSIKNLSDGGRETLLSDIPSGVTEIVLDQQRGVIKNNAGENLYDKFNFQFCRLIRGNNILQFSGRFTAEFICEFPLNMGV